jgi:hypothetical protein
MQIHPCHHSQALAPHTSRMSLSWLVSGTPAESFYLTFIHPFSQGHTLPVASLTQAVMCRVRSRFPMPTRTVVPVQHL